MIKKKMEIILHVGLHKTATSSIQSSLSNKKNSKLLKKKGVLYPKQWPINHSIPVYSAFCDTPENYHINIRQKLNNKQIVAQNKAYLDQLIKEVSANKPEKLIISGEDISVLDLSGLESFKLYLVKNFNPSKIRIVVYVRNPISLAVSKMQEDIKSGMHTINSSISINLDNKEHSIKKRLVDIEQVFSKKYMEVYTFEDAVKCKHGPVGHFLSIIGCHSSHDIDNFIIERSNESLSSLAACIISFINNKHLLFRDGVINEPRFNGDTRALSMLSGPRFDLTLKDKKDLMNTYRDEIFWLKNNWNVDYDLIVQHKDDESKDIITRDQLLQLKEIYIASSEFIRGLIVDYLNEHVSDEFEVSPSEFHELLTALEERQSDTLSKNSSEERIRSVLGISGSIETAEIYREIALMLESCGEIGAALVLMKKASKLRPDGPFMAKKIKEYALKC